MLPRKASILHCFVLFVLPAIPPLETATVLPTALRRNVAVIVSLVVVAVTLSMILMMIAIIAYRKKAPRCTQKIATSATSPRTTKHSTFDSEVQAKEAYSVANPDAVAENEVHGLTDNPSVTSSVQTKQAIEVGLLDPKDEAYGVATTDAAENKVHDTDAVAENKVHGRDAVTENNVHDTDAVTENKVHGTDAVTENKVHGTDAVTENKVHGTDAVTENKAHGADVTENNVHDTDPVTKNKVHDTLSQTSSVQSRHSFHGILRSDSIVCLDELEVKCEHSICKDLDHGHDHGVVGKTESQDHSYAMVKVISDNRMFHKRDKAGLLAEKSAYSTTDIQGAKYKNNRMSAKGCSSPNIVAERRPYGITDRESHKTVKDSDRFAMGQVSYPTFIQTIPKDQERSNLIFKKHRKDTAIRCTMSAEGCADPNIAKRRLRGMTDDASHSIVNESIANHSSHRIIQVFSADRGRSELNSLPKKGAYSTTDVHDGLKNQAHGMSIGGILPKDQGGLNMKLEISISEGHDVGYPTKKTYGTSRVVLSEHVPAEGTDFHSSRTRPYSSMTEVHPLISISVENNVHCKSESHISPPESI